MTSFIDKLFIEYPVPKEVSCWGSRPGVPPLESIETLVDTALDELASDVQIRAAIEANGMVTQMPEGTITCTSAMLSAIYPFQGNRLVKVTYDAAANRAYLRYYPATISYLRHMNREDLDNLKGDRLIYFKAYCLWKMAERELLILKTARLETDNGTIDMSVLEEFRNNKKDYYTQMKDQILIYSTVW